MTEAVESTTTISCSSGTNPGETKPGLLHCHACGACGNVRVCLGCHEVYYCNKECQKKEWIMHRIWCKTRQKQLAYQEEQKRLAQTRKDMASRPSYLSSSSSEQTSTEQLELTPKQITERYLAKPERDDPTAVFCMSIEEGLRRSARVSPDLPDVVSFCLAYIEKYGLEEEGVFRLSGSLREVATLRYLFQQGKYPSLNDIHDVNVATNLLKLYFRELPEPLFKERDDYVQGSYGNISPYREVLESISIERRRIAYALFRLLHLIVQHSDKNKMSGGNIAIVLSPTLRAASDTVDQLTLHFDKYFTDADAPALPPEWPDITEESRCVQTGDTNSTSADS